MALTSTYLTQTKNLEDMLASIRGAQAPEKFSSKFLTDLGYDRTSDRLIIGMFKALGFVDESGSPTELYFAYLDETQSDKILAQGIREAYGDLFRVNKAAYDMDQPELKQKLKTLFRGSKSESVLQKMTMTFVSLCALADFDGAVVEESQSATPDEEELPIEEPPVEQATRSPLSKVDNRPNGFDLSYRIHIELPSTRDQAVYDAIFKSLKEHIL